MLNDENSEHFPEILRERRRFFKEKQKAQDFWIVANPAFLDAMPDVKAKIRQPCVAVVTTDRVWNDFVKLRMDRVYKGGVEGAARDIFEELGADRSGGVQGAQELDCAIQQVRRGLVGCLYPGWRLLNRHASRTSLGFAID